VNEIFEKISYQQLEQLFSSTRLAILATVLNAGILAAAFLLFPDGHIAHQLFLAFIIAGMVAGAAASLSAIFSVAAAFLFLILVPLGVRHTTVSYSNYRCLCAC